MNLLFLETKPTVFGGQKALLERCKILDDLGLNYTVAHPYASSKFADSFRRSQLLGELETADKKFGSIGRVLYIARAAHKSAKKADTIIHCDAFDSAYVVAALKLLKLIRGAKLVFTIRSERYLRFGWMDRMLLAQHDKLATNSYYSKVMIESSKYVSGREVIVTYSPINFKASASTVDLDSDPVTRIGFVGSLEPRKRLDRFVDFCSRLSASRPNERIEMSIFGDIKKSSGSKGHNVAKSAVDFATHSPLFELKGYQSIDNILESIDIAFCPFDNEPFGRVVSELLYGGVRVIAMNSGGMSEAGGGYAEMISGPSEEDAYLQFVAAYDAIVRSSWSSDKWSEVRASLTLRFSAATVVAKELQIYSSLGLKVDGYSNAINEGNSE